MSTKLQESSDPIDQYIQEHSLRLTAEQKEIIEYTKTLPSNSLPFSDTQCHRLTLLDTVSAMLGSLDEAQFFQVIIQLMGCKRCIEVGTLTGYTSLTIALGLPSDGHLITCDIDDQYVRQDLWKKAGVHDKILLKIGPAVETLKKLLEENGPGSFDFIFIDGDKPNYMNYYQLAIELVRSNGLIAIDNTIWCGKIVDLSDTTEKTVAIREVNDFVRDDQRVDISFLRLGDGTTLCRKK